MKFINQEGDVIEAIKYTGNGESFEEVEDFLGEKEYLITGSETHGALFLYCDFLIPLKPNTWIIKTEYEYWPCPEDNFNKWFKPYEGI